MLRPISIDATTLSDAWFQTLYKCVELGRKFVIDEGSFKSQKRLEFDYITIHIKHPDKGDLIPKVNPLLGFPDPVEEGYVDDYLPYLMTGEEKKGEAYTYGQRICKESIEFFVPNNYKHIIDDLKEGKLNHSDIITENEMGIHFLNQMELMIWTYKNKGYRNNQMILQVSQPSDMLLIDPPCLRHIDTRIQDDKLHFFPYFRSWDLWNES